MARLLSLLILLASCIAHECYCASLSSSEDNAIDRSSSQSSQARETSRFRQLNSIEPFLEDRARQLATRQGSLTSADAFASLTGNGNSISSSERQARQLAFPYGPYNSQAQLAPPQQALAYGQASSNVYYPQQQQQQQQQPQQQQPLYYNQAGAGSQAYWPAQDSSQAAYLRPGQQQQQYAANNQQQQQQYGANLYEATKLEPTKLVYEQAEEKKSVATSTAKPASSLQYKAQLPVLHEVIELADPNVRVFSTKPGAKKQKNAKTVITFKLARRVRVPLESSKVMQPEFYLQDDTISIPAGKSVPSKLLVATTTTTTTSTSTTTTPQPNQNSETPAEGSEKEGDERDSNATEAAASEQEAPQQQQQAEQENSGENAPSEANAESPEQEAEAEVDAQLSEGKSRLQGDELARLDQAAARRKPEVEDKDKVLNDFGKDKIDKLSNFLQFGEKHATKLAKKVGLEHRTPDEAAEQQAEAAAGGDGRQKSDHQVLASEQDVLGSLAPPLEVSLADVDGRLGSTVGIGNGESEQESSD